MIIPVGYAQVNFKFGGLGLPLGGEVAIGVDNRGSDRTALDIATRCGANWVANLKEPTNTHVTLLTVLAKKGPNATGAFAEVVVNDTGTNATGDFNPSTAALVKKITGLGGRHGRGRMYLPMAGEDDTLTGGQLQPTFLTGVQPSLDDFLAQFTTDDLPMVLLHAVSLPLPTPVTSLAIEAQIAIQRRRNRK